MKKNMQIFHESLIDFQIALNLVSIGLFESHQLPLLAVDYLEKAKDME